MTDAGERAEPRSPRRFPGKPVALALATILIVGTALSTYFAWRAELARQRAAATPAPAAGHP